jgi:PAS domain S-box-containing protein
MPTASRFSGLHPAFLDRANDLMGALDLRGCLTAVNMPVEHLTWRPQPELLGLPAVDLVAAMYRDETRAFYARQIARRIATTYYELPIVTARHRTVWIAVHAHLHRRGSRVAGLHLVARDLTERKQLQANLQRSEVRSRQLVAECPIAIVTASPDGHVRACNPAFVRLAGFTSVADAVGSDLRALYPRDDLARQLQRVRTQGAVQAEEAELRCVDGRVLQIVQTLIGRVDEHDLLTAVTGYLVDDTPRQALQAQVRHALTMEALGRMASGLAQDFNNLLMVINGLAEGLLERVPTTDPSRIEVKQILDAGTRGSALALQLIDATRKQAAGDALTIATAAAPGGSGTGTAPGATPSQGSTPAGAMTPAAAIDETIPATPPETILVVDDETPVRVLLADALRRLGYHVLTAEDAATGLVLLREHVDRVRLLLTDMVMPGKSGRELAREAQRLNPALPVLLMSGYPDRSNMSESGRLPRSGFLQKPFALDVLALKVRQMLDEPE